MVPMGCQQPTALPFRGVAYARQDLPQQCSMAGAQRRHKQPPVPPQLGSQVSQSALVALAGGQVAARIDRLQAPWAELAERHSAGEKRPLLAASSSEHW
mmetsp:Transcript_9637/g.28452  ORF Transcript_9637/g.28452 Transcript_9637/m.28452 type:complete len:99 (-) Transcript_9637:49-345(-)